MLNKRTLLLNDSYELLSFISFRKVIKLLSKEKVEVLSTWEDDDIVWINGKIKYPAVLRLRNHIHRSFVHSNFSRKALVKRDNSCCQYCGKKLSASQITVDHVIPRSRGGATSFSNCVVSCHTCNNVKADRTPEQAEMILLKKPCHPSFTAHSYLVDPQDGWHPEWDTFLGNI